MHITNEDPRLWPVTELLVDLLGIGTHKIGPATRLVEDMGLDSLDEVEMLMAIEEEYDIDIPDEDLYAGEGDSKKFLFVTLQDILDYLNKRLGPAEPIDGVLRLTDSQFCDRYRPETNEEDGSYYRQRDWCVDADVKAIDEAKPSNLVWTAVDDDDGRLCIVNGLHRVNRIYYIITARPPENPDWNIAVYDPEDEPVYIRCTVDWDTDGDPEASPPNPVDVNLRDALGLGVEDVTEENSSEIADYLSDHYGWCVKSFQYTKR